jgi:hypothetical protein
VSCGRVVCVGTRVQILQLVPEGGDNKKIGCHVGIFNDMASYLRREKK